MESQLSTQAWEGDALDVQQAFVGADAFDGVNHQDPPEIDDVELGAFLCEALAPDANHLVCKAEEDNSDGPSSALPRHEPMFFAV